MNGATLYRWLIGRMRRAWSLHFARTADAQALVRSAALKFSLATTRVPARAATRTGREAAELAVDDIRAAIDDAHMLFITAGMAVPAISRPGDCRSASRA
jgi:hypothetical protein